MSQNQEPLLTIEGYVRAGKSLKAIQELILLIDNLNDEPMKSLHLLCSRFNNNKTAESNNQESRTLTKMESDRITYSLLDIIQDVKSAIQEKFCFSKSITQQSNMEDYLHTRLSKRQKKINKFYLDIYLVFDPANLLEFLDKITADKPGDVSSKEEYAVFLEAFLKTVEACDPRWRANATIRQAWAKVKNKILAQLQVYTPMPENPILYNV
jgi:hypothetical protein